MASEGICFASATASSKKEQLAMIVALVTIPLRWHSAIARFTP